MNAVNTVKLYTS